MAQELGDEAMVARELAHGVLGILLAAEPQGRELECRGPALRALAEHLELRVAEPEVGPAPEERPHLPAP